MPIAACFKSPGRIDISIVWMRLIDRGGGLSHGDVDNRSLPPVYLDRGQDRGACSSHVLS